MSNDLNRCEFIGRLGRDPEIRYSASGDAVANISIACGWKSKDKEGAEWVPIMFFGKLAEIVGKYLSKGSQVYVAGRFRTRKWKDQSGQDRYTTEIIANEMQMLGGKNENSSGGSQGENSGGAGSAGPGGENSSDDFDDDIPF